MDRVRFGRALGAGAREAARALVKAADAAAAPNPNASSPVRPAADPAQPATRMAQPEIHSPGRSEENSGARAARQIIRARRSAATTTRGVREGSSRFGKAVWGPFVKLSGVLWLEMTGVFFGLFALTAGVGVWRSRGELHAGGAAQHRFWFAIAMLALFGYFSVSSFLRARRRGRT